MNNESLWGAAAEQVKEQMVSNFLKSSFFKKIFLKLKLFDFSDSSPSPNSYIVTVNDYSQVMQLLDSLMQL